MTAALEGGEWSAARPGRTLPPGKTWYPFYRRLGGPQGRCGRTENLVPTGIRSRTVQLVVSRYTDWEESTSATFRVEVYRGADKSLARPGMKQARKHVSDARDFNNIETRALITFFFFLQDKAPKEIHAILTETACFLFCWMCAYLKLVPKFHKTGCIAAGCVEDIYSLTVCLWKGLHVWCSM